MDTRLNYIFSIFILMSVFDLLQVIVTVVNDGIINLDGSPGIIDHQEIWNRLDPISGFMYWFGDLDCHQMTERSIIIGSSQMPFCVRETMFMFGIPFGFFAIATSYEKMINGFKFYLSLSTILFMTLFVEYIFRNSLGPGELIINGIVSFISGFSLMIVIFLVSGYVFDKIKFVSFFEK